MDEIQNLDASRNNTASYDSLMTIINTTKIALVVVGTDRAFASIFRKQYTARRAGDIIRASNYCPKLPEFCAVMKHITSINWFKKEVEISPVIYEALHQTTNGIIDSMISLWINILEVIRNYNVIFYLRLASENV